MSEAYRATLCDQDGAPLSAEQRLVFANRLATVWAELAVKRLNGGVDGPRSATGSRRSA